MSEYFPKPNALSRNVKVELNLSKCVTKTDLKHGKVIYTSKFDKKIDVASLNSKIDKLDIHKLKTTPVDLSKLCDVVKNEAVEKAVFNELVKKLMLVLFRY